ncbi:MAG: hypothetical protein GY795_17680, partial [Desulfobacterales bacterium]|nr:hypothetical protein [Desulfobacterales bacterium]
MAEIIDISNHQGRPDWNVVSRHVELSIAKATEGTYFRDGSFAHNWHGAARHGVQRGAYHFIYPRGG